ncbi:MAG: hypothetical protein RSE20_10120 [Eubacterium sp.]
MLENSIEVDVLMKDLHIYANYEQLEEEAYEKGGVMKESKECYGWRILEILERIFRESE